MFNTHDLPVIFTEHKKLGKLAEPITEVAPKAKVVEKHHFSAMKEKPFIDYLKSIGKKQIVLAGAESHVCLYQTAIDLKEAGYDVFILSDSVSSRSESDYKAAVERLKSHQFEMITKEMLFFELIEHSELSNYLDLALKFLDGRYIR